MLKLLARLCYQNSMNVKLLRKPLWQECLDYNNTNVQSMYSYVTVVQVRARWCKPEWWWMVASGYQPRRPCGQCSFVFYIFVVFAADVVVVVIVVCCCWCCCCCCRMPVFTTVAVTDHHSLPKTFRPHVQWLLWQTCNFSECFCLESVDWRRTFSLFMPGLWGLSHNSLYCCDNYDGHQGLPLPLPPNSTNWVFIYEPAAI